MSFWWFEISGIPKKYLEENIPWGRVLNIVLEMRNLIDFIMVSCSQNKEKWKKNHKKIWIQQIRDYFTRVKFFDNGFYISYIWDEISQVETHTNLPVDNDDFWIFRKEQKEDISETRLAINPDWNPNILDNIIDMLRNFWQAEKIIEFFLWLDNDLFYLYFLSYFTERNVEEIDEGFDLLKLDSNVLKDIILIIDSSIESDEWDKNVLEIYQKIRIIAEQVLSSRGTDRESLRNL
jgi:hypothetical protein